MAYISNRCRVAAGTLCVALLVSTAAASAAENWCSDTKIRFFTGGAEGDAFGSIVHAGAIQAAEDTGADVDYLFSGWEMETMVQQLREAVASDVDGIAMMGHPGNSAIAPLAEDAAAKGIIMQYQNTDVPDVRSAHGGGYVGAQLVEQGKALGERAIADFELGAGDTAVVFGDWTTETRALRELATVDALKAGGVEVIKLDTTPEMAADPNLGIPVVTAALVANPNTKLIAYPGGQMLGNAVTYMQAAGKAPGEIINIGFDTSPQIISAFEEGWVHLTSDQQPFLQGYLPILSICLQHNFDFGPISYDTGAGFVDVNNYKSVAELAKAGLR